jgi:hypothetical protein
MATFEEPIEEVSETVESITPFQVESVTDAGYTAAGGGLTGDKLAEVAAEGGLHWADDGSRAKHTDYMDDDEDGSFRINHREPVDREGDVSLALQNELGQRLMGE